MVASVRYSDHSEVRIMFTRINLRNFRSFDSIEFDLTKKGNSPKNLAIIYGENGAGKSNLLSAFVLLDELLGTMDVRDTYEELLTQKAIFNDEELEKNLRQRLMSGLRDMQAIIDDYGMIGSDMPIVAEYEFCIAGNFGRYVVEFGEKEILHERLEYLLNKRRGIYFDCSTEAITINGNIVKDHDFLSDIKATAKRFWGKHSILAIVLHELYDKSNAYAWDNISDNFFDVITEFKMISCSIGIGTRRWNQLTAPLEVLEDPIQGRLAKSNETQLDVAENIFTQFFSAVNSNIKKVYYERTYSDSKINYKLYFEVFIANSSRRIPFSMESTGIHQLIKVLCCILSACVGGTVILDEADSGIHDLLFQKIIKETKELISGQLILSTHNTMLMESEIPQDSIYVISEDSTGHKSVRCINDYQKRTYLSSNIRNKYLNNEYGGLPEVHEVNFPILITQLSKELDKK